MCAKFDDLEWLGTIILSPVTKCNPQSSQRSARVSLTNLFVYSKLSFSCKTESEEILILFNSRSCQCRLLCWNVSAWRWRNSDDDDDDVQAEKELSEVNLQLESLHERLEEADGLSSAQVDKATHPIEPICNLDQYILQLCLHVILFLSKTTNDQYYSLRLWFQMLTHLYLTMPCALFSM